MQKLVSIIVPVYNVEKYIDKCVRSLLKQDYGNKALENMAVIIICAILVAAVLGALGRELKIHIDLLKPKSNEPHQNDDSDISTSWEDR